MVPFENKPDPPGLYWIMALEFVKIRKIELANNTLVMFTAYLISVCITLNVIAGLECTETHPTQYSSKSKVLTRKERESKRPTGNLKKRVP